MDKYRSMKMLFGSRLLVLLAALFFLAGHTGCDSTTVSAQDTGAALPTQDSTWLHVQTAAAGTLIEKPGEPGIYILTLDNVAPHTIEFADRPFRRITRYDNDTFLEYWNPASPDYLPDPPDAALETHLENQAMDIAIVELLSVASFNQGQTLEYEVRPLGQAAGNLWAFAGREDNIEDIPPVLDHIKLFINLAQSKARVDTNAFGVCYSPFHDRDYCSNVESRLHDDFPMVADHFSLIKTYYPSYCGTKPQLIMDEAVKNNLKAILGIYLKNQWADDYQKDAISLAQSYPGDVLGIIIGNENKQDQGQPSDPPDYLTKIQNFSGAIKSALPNLPVGTAQTITFWCGADPTLCVPAGDAITIANMDNVDFLGLNIYPETDNSVDAGVADTFNKITRMKTAYKKYGKQVVVTETGWPSEGCGNCTWTNEKDYLEKYRHQWANDQTATFFYQMFDWPDCPYNQTCKHFGMYTYDNKAKQPPIGKY